MQPHRLLHPPPPFPLPREGGIILQRNARRPSPLCRSSVTVTAGAEGLALGVRACKVHDIQPRCSSQAAQPTSQNYLHTMQTALLCNTPHSRLPSVAKSQSGRKKNRRRNRQVFCELGRELSLHSRAPAASPAFTSPPPATDEPSINVHAAKDGHRRAGRVRELKAAAQCMTIRIRTCSPSRFCLIKRP